MDFTVAYTSEDKNGNLAVSLSTISLVYEKKSLNCRLLKDYLMLLNLTNIPIWTYRLQNTKNKNLWLKTLTQNLNKKYFKRCLGHEKYRLCRYFKNTTKISKCAATSSDRIVKSVTQLPPRIPVLTFFFKLLKDAGIINFLRDAGTCCVSKQYFGGDEGGCYGNYLKTTAEEWKKPSGPS